MRGCSPPRRNSGLTLDGTVTTDRYIAARVGHWTHIVAWACTALLLPMPARGETLLEAYSLARQNDPKFRVAQAESRASSMAIDQARAGFLPTIKLDMEATETRQRVLSSQNITFNAGVATFPTKNDTLSVNQPIFRMDADRPPRAGQGRGEAGRVHAACGRAGHVVAYHRSLSGGACCDRQPGIGQCGARSGGQGARPGARQRLKMGLGTITNQYDAAGPISRHAGPRDRGAPQTARCAPGLPRDHRQG